MPIKNIKERIYAAPAFKGLNIFQCNKNMLISPSSFSCLKENKRLKMAEAVISTLILTALN